MHCDLGAELTQPGELPFLPFPALLSASIKWNDLRRGQNVIWHKGEKTHHLGRCFSLPKKILPVASEMTPIKRCFLSQACTLFSIPSFSGDQVRQKEIDGPLPFHMEFHEKFSAQTTPASPNWPLSELWGGLASENNIKKHAQGAWRGAFGERCCLAVSLWEKHRQGNASWSLRFLNMSVWVTKDFYAPLQTLFKHCYSCKHATRR